MADMKLIQNGAPMGFRRQLSLTAQLAAPAILAQLSTILMQYIDAAMVGRLGADDSASVGLMNSSLWLFWGVCSMITMGFSVQVAHRLGAKDTAGARGVLRQAIVTCLIAGSAVAAIGMAIAPRLPVWLGGDASICHGASVYFFVFVAALPLLTMNYLGSGMLRCAGNMRVPTMLSLMMCVLDVVFNFLLIFPTRSLSVSGFSFTMPGAGLGVLGAALGTVSAEAICASAMMWHLCRREPELNLRGSNGRGSYRPTRDVVGKAARISTPMVLQQMMFCGAQIMVTIIVAPLGVTAIAANAFAVTAESLCYMPGFGIADAATTLCGQCYGARRFRLARHFCWLTTALGITVMSFMGIVMYVFAPEMMEIMTPVRAIAEAGTEVLRIEAWAEPMYAAAIVAYGAFVGVGDTKLPAIMNFGSIWLVRIPLAAIMAPVMGLRGVWIAMAIELTFRGLIFLSRMKWGSWLRPDRTPAEADIASETPASL